MGQIAGFEIPFDMPSFSGSGIAITISIVLALFVIVAGLIILIWAIYRAKVYKYRIVHFENIANAGYQHTFTDKARLVKIGDGGEEIFYLRKTKSFRTAYGRKQGRNIFWFAKGQDGYWYNFLLGDLDAKFGILDVEPVDRDMRMMHVAIRKNITERYRKLNVMEKYGGIIISAVFIIILIVGGWFLLDKIGDIASQLGSTLKANEAVSETLLKVVGKLDTLCGGSGIQAV